MNFREIQCELEQEARAFVERNPVNKKGDPRIAAKLKEFLAARDISQVKFAKQIGVSSATISQYIQGKYNGNVAEIDNKVSNSIETSKRREAKNRSTLFIKTSVAVKIGTLITQTDGFSVDEGKIGLVIGDGGHGKSKCLEHYAEVNKNAVYIELDRAMGNKLMFADIAKALKLDPSGSQPTVTRRIIDELRSRKVILLLDEASSLKVKHLDMLRQIIAVKGRCPFVLAGNSDLLNTVMQPKTRYGYESLDQFTSRLMGILNLDELINEKDGKGGSILYTPGDIRKLYEYEGVRLTDGGVTILTSICHAPRSGHFRTCTLIISALHTSKTVVNGGKIDKSMIVGVIKQLNLPVKKFLPVHWRQQDNEEDEKQAVAAV